MKVDFWLDPVCPWCWMTSRWIIEVAPHRDLDIYWRSISLKIKNADNPDHPYAGLYNSSHRLLRVIEALRAEQGDAPIGALYTEYGTRIHEQQDLDFDPSDALVAVGLDRHLGAAADDLSWDGAVAAETAAGLALTGSDVGTPLLGFDGPDGVPVGFFGPVISRTLDPDDGLRLWDNVYGAAQVPGFWELKRTRTEPAAVGFRPPT